jgi:hypothetical protein
VSARQNEGRVTSSFFIFLFFFVIFLSSCCSWSVFGDGTLLKQRFADRAGRNGGR